LKEVRFILDKCQLVKLW